MFDQVEVRLAGEAFGELDGIGDGGAGEQEARLAAVNGCDAPEAPEDIGHVRAEHAAVDVSLVDDHEGQVGQQLAPGRVVGQDPDVEHVGVGEDEVRALADGGALATRRVAVVDRRPDQLVEAEAVERASLVLGQRLGWIDVERPGGAVAGEGLQRGELEAERLPGRRPRGDDRRAVERLVQRIGLV